MEHELQGGKTTGHSQGVSRRRPRGRRKGPSKPGEVGMEKGGG